LAICSLPNFNEIDPWLACVGSSAIAALLAFLCWKEVMDLLPELVFQGLHSRAVCINPDASKLIVRFDHWSSGKSGFGLLAPWRLTQDRQFAQLNVQVARNDFYLNDDLTQLRQDLRRFTKRFTHIQALGFSMGGFGALLLSRALRLHHVVLVSPQRPGFPRQPPFSTDLKVEQDMFRSGIDARLDGIRGCMRGVILYDPRVAEGRDMAYAKKIMEMAPKLKPLALPGAGHPATRLIAQAKLYGQFQSSLLERQKFIGKIRTLHQVACHSLKRIENPASEFPPDLV